jgi:hypothetical protein
MWNYNLNYKERKYHLTTDDDNKLYLLTKYENNRLYSYKNKSEQKHMIKNIYNVIQCITKLKKQRIKKYRIFTQFELEIICDFLNKNNILYSINIEYKNTVTILSYTKFKERKNHYFENCIINNNYGEIIFNKIYKFYTLYITVYKEYINLCKLKLEEKVLGIYLYESKILYNNK